MNRGQRTFMTHMKIGQSWSHEKGTVYETHEKRTVHDMASKYIFLMIR